MLHSRYHTVFIICQLLMVVACSKAPEPTVGTSGASSAQDLRDAELALQADVEDLSSDEALAIGAAEKTRNDALAAKLGSPEGAQQAECERLRLQLSQLEAIERNGQVELSETDRAALPATLQDTRDRIAARCL
jgi:hypothetical protein